MTGALAGSAEAQHPRADVPPQRVAQPALSASNWRVWRPLYVVGLLVADVTAAGLAIVCTYLVRPTSAHHRLAVLRFSMSYRELGLVVLVAWLATLAASGAYRPHYPTPGLRDYRLPVTTALRLMGVVAVVAFALRAPVSRAFVVVFFPCLLGWSLVMRWCVRKLHGRLRAHGRALNRLVIAGDATAVVKFVAHLRRANPGFLIAGLCVPHALALGRDAELWRGTPDDAVRVAAEVGADSVAVVGHPSFSETSLQQVAWQLERVDVDLLVAPDVVELAGPRVHFAPVTGVPLLRIDEARISGGRRFVKTVYERLLALPVTLLALPLLGLGALVVLIGSGRPVFYRQRRVGLSGREFDMLKFRTMVPDADERLVALLAANEHDGLLFKIRDDPRVTRVGRFLRRFSLDELPQLINVLKGDMVLIGPRPCLPREAAQFGEAAQRRFLARPGMTGLWQVSGRSDLGWEDGVRLDLYYVENWSPLLDLMILYRTLRVVVTGHGAY